ncbi:MAG: hypothetical protein ACI8W7_004713 [Gammaproteobacteria bacterium]|jgi:hypothetical protein
MSGFSAEWLAMREGADAKARSDRPVHALNDWLRDSPTASIIDLGCGSGSNLRWLASRVAAHQHWQLIDNDQHLLSQASDSLRDWASARSALANNAERDSQSAAQVDDAAALRLSEGLSVRLTRCDLSTQLPSLHGTDLLCASALLDLVSRDWLSMLIAECERQQVAAYFALNYDGRMRFTPGHADDAMIRDALNRDQCADKGFGPALGPDCVAALHSQCQAHHYRLVQWRSDWRLGADEQPLHAQLVSDFAQIAERNLPHHQHQRVRAWQRWRRERCGASTLSVGHVDALALPYAPRAAATRPLKEHFAPAIARASTTAKSPSK